MTAGYERRAESRVENNNLADDGGVLRRAAPGR